VSAASRSTGRRQQAGPARRCRIDCRQWSGQTTGLDTVAGPDDQVRFVTGYRAQHINLFRPRLLVDAGDQMAYLWDVTLPDGTVWTGADANLVRDGEPSTGDPLSTPCVGARRCCGPVARVPTLATYRPAA
jgi:hypothetical protein